MLRDCVVGEVRIGSGRPLAIIAGPCLLESRELGMTIGREVADACRDLALPYIFKASFDKANRSSVHSSRGPGLDRGLKWLGDIGQSLGTPVTTDIHDPGQAEALSETIDLIQIPAFLCRQTDLLSAAGEHASRRGRAVNVKKGQFLSPGEMLGPIRKLGEVGCADVLVTERGTTFGYHRLVNDFIGLGDLLELDAPGGAPPVCFDCTHSTQTPGTGETTGGRRERAPLLARAAVASGVHALFLECHPDPARALSDAATQIPLDQVGEVLRSVAAIRRAMTA
ncbi:MAG: 3-deoxy-8-phosphooctulonate synthase [Phycisphaeraceae bacterium]|nr:3-deoxy-8-phosphooctulonate synthase [Phycisphaeraceae bacterium]